MYNGGRINKKHMQKIPRGIVAIAIVIVLTGVLFYYQYAQKEVMTSDRAVLPPARPTPTTAATPTPTSTTREVSVVTTYDVPEADITHQVKFTAVLDTEGRVLTMKMAEMPKEEASVKQQEFADNLTMMIKGKKLSELTRVDKVGKSTITTDAFNAILGGLRSQL